jgi:hypothetical protein
MGSLGAQLLIGCWSPRPTSPTTSSRSSAARRSFPSRPDPRRGARDRPAPRLRPASLPGALAAGGGRRGRVGRHRRGLPMVGPLYGLEVGLTTDQIAHLPRRLRPRGRAGAVPGRLARRQVRPPLGADLAVGRLDRPAPLTIALSTGGGDAIFLASALLRLHHLPDLFGLGRPCPRLRRKHERVELSAALMFLYAIGAIASPLIASVLIERYGRSACSSSSRWRTSCSSCFGLARMRRRPHLVPDRTVCCAALARATRIDPSAPPDGPPARSTRSRSSAASTLPSPAGVNKATRALFQVADTPEKMLDLGEEGLVEHIRTIGLFRNKAKNVIRSSAASWSRSMAARSRPRAPRCSRCRGWGARPPMWC